MLKYSARSIRKDSVASAALLLAILLGSQTSMAQGTYTDSAIDNLSGAFNSGSFTFETSGTNNVQRTMGATLSGGVAVTKTGSGDGTTTGSDTVVMTQDNTYSGWTTVSAGTLKITGSISGSHINTNGGNVIFDAAGKTSTIAADGYNYAVKITFQSSNEGSLTINAGTVNVTSSDSKASINLGVSGTGSGVLTVNNGKLHVDGRILMAANNNQAKSTLTLNGGEIDLGVPGKYTVGGDPACGVLWVGSGTTTINLNGGTLSMFGMINNGPSSASSFNFNGGTVKAVASNNSSFFLNGSNMKFNVLAGGAKFDTNGFDVTASPALSGVGDLTKMGEGTLTLSGANTYSGTTTVPAGTLRVTGSISGSHVIVNGGNLIFDAAGKTSTLPGNNYREAVKIGDGNGTTGSMTVKAGTVNVTGTNNTASINLGINGSTGGVLTVDGGKLHVDGRILMGANNGGAASKGTINLNKGELELGVSGKYSTNGDPGCGILWYGEGTSIVNINGGTLSMFGSIVTSAVTAGSAVNFNGGTIKAVANNSNTFLVKSDNLAYNVLGGGAKFDTNGFNVTVSPDLTGAGGLTKLGAGTLTLSGANTYSGVTKVSGGTLKLAESGSLNLASGISIDKGAIFDIGATSRKLKLQSTGKVQSGTLKGDNVTVTLANSGGDIWTSIDLGTSGKLIVDSSCGDIAWQGKYTFDSMEWQRNGGVLWIYADSTVSGDLRTATGNTNETTLRLGCSAETNGNPLTFNGAIDGKYSVLIQNEHGDSNPAKTVVFSKANSYQGATNIFDGTLLIKEDGTMGAGAVTNNTSLVFENTNGQTIANAISGTGSVTVQGDADTTIAFSGANTYSGDTTINAGNVTLTGAGSLGNGTLTTASGSTVTITEGWSGNLVNSSFNIMGTLNDLSESKADFLKGSSLTVDLVNNRQDAGILSYTGEVDIAGLNLSLTNTGDAIDFGDEFLIVSAADFDTYNIGDLSFNSGNNALLNYESALWQYDIAALAGGGYGLLAIASDRASVPEPTTWVLLTLGLAGLYQFRRKRTNS